MSRRRAKAGAPLGFVAEEIEVRPLTEAERHDLAAALGVTIDRLDAPLKPGMPTFDAVLACAVTEFVRRRLAEPMLPTEREVSAEYAALAARLEEFAQSIVSPDRPVIAGGVVTARATVRALEFGGEIDDHLRAALDHARAAAVLAREAAARHEAAAARQARRPPTAARILFADVRRFMSAAGVPVTLPTDAAADTAADRPFFRAARAALVIAKTRFDEAARAGRSGAVAAASEAARVLGLSPKALLRHLRAARPAI